MKNTILFLFLLLLMQNGFAQNNNYRKLYGSFVAGNAPFNYEFTQNTKSGYALQIEPIYSIKDLSTLVSTQIEKVDGIKNLFEKKEEFQQLKDSLFNVKSKNDALVKSLKGLKKASDKLNGILNKDKVDNLLVNKKIFKSNLDSLKKQKKVFNKFLKEILTGNYDFVIHTKLDTIKVDNKTLLKDLTIEDNDTLTRNKIVKILFPIYETYSENISKLENFIVEYDTFLQQINFDNPTIFSKSTNQFYEFEINVFRGIFNDLLKTVAHETYMTLLSNEKKKGADDETIQDVSDRIFYEIKTRLAFEDEEPIIALVKLRNSYAKIYADTSKTPVNFINIDWIELEFEDGTIKNIELILNNDNSKEYYRFRNIKPIAISGKFHSDKIIETYLFSDGNNLSQNYYVKLSDIIYYLPALQNNTENYAPSNQVIKLDPKVALTFDYLKKELTSKIIDVRVFSDLQGVKVNEPNGLIQAEISRKIDFNANHRQPFWLGVRLGNKSSLSFIRYMRPQLTLSKIEKKDIGYFYQNKDQLSNLELMKNQFIRFSNDLSIFKYNYPNLQGNLQLIYSTSWFGSNIAESSTPPSNAVDVKFTQVYSTLQKLGLLFEILPESRWGANLRWDFMSWYHLLGTGYTVTKSESTNKFISSLHNINTLNFEGYLKTSKNNKFFFRWQYNYADTKTNFHQLQIGVLSSLQSYVESNKK